MAVLKSSIFFFVFISGCAYATNSTQVSINSSLNNCISINKYEAVMDGGIPMLRLVFETRKSISECGCKSALSLYSSYVKLDGYESSLISGKFMFPGNGALEFPIATSNKLIGKNNVRINISCALPD